MGSVVPHHAASVLQGILDLLDGGGEQEHREAELGHLGLLLAQELPRCIDVEVPVLVVPWVVNGVKPPEAHRAERSGGYVRPGSQLRSGDLVAGVGEGKEDGNVGDGPRNGSDVDELRVEDPLGKLQALQLDLVHIYVALVVPLAGHALCVAVVEVGDHHLLGQRAHQVLGGDHGERPLEPIGVLLHLLSNPACILFHECYRLDIKQLLIKHVVTVFPRANRASRADATRHHAVEALPPGLQLVYGRHGCGVHLPEHRQIVAYEVA